MLSKHKIPCDKLPDSTFRLNKLPRRRIEVRFSAYNENHIKSATSEISRSSEAEKKKRRDRKEEKRKKEDQASPAVCR